MKPVRKVVFPVNGLGTRFLPATKAMPKEMLPIVDKPLIQYAVEEAAAAGMTEMIFVTGRNKRAIEDHFDAYPELERELAEKGKDELLEIVKSIVPPGVKCIYIRQPKALGLGHAVLCAEPVVGDEPFAVMLADDLVDAPSSCVGQLVKAREAQGGGSGRNEEGRHRQRRRRRRAHRAHARHGREARSRRGALASCGDRPLRLRTRNLQAPRRS